jgi:hypothetical protein
VSAAQRICSSAGIGPRWWPGTSHGSGSVVVVVGGTVVVVVVSSTVVVVTSGTDVVDSMIVTGEEATDWPSTVSGVVHADPLTATTRATTERVRRTPAE